MNGTLDLSGDFCLRLTFTLLHFLWQGLALALLALAAGALLRHARPAVRYGLFVAALAAMALCSPVTFLALAPHQDSLRIANAPVKLNPPVHEDAAPVMIPARPVKGIAAQAPVAPRPNAVTTSPKPFSLKERLHELVTPEACRRAAPGVALAYFAGVLLMLARLLLALRGGRRLRGQSQPVTESALLASLAHAAESVRLRTVPALAWCARVAVPTVVGILKPTILLPFSLASGFSGEQVEMLLLHELAHLRRHDHWVNLAQWVVETLLFFHPAVWWLSRRIRAERELCCDDMVLGAGAESSTYAESLLRMAELSRRTVAQPAAVALGAGGPRSWFGRRVLRLIDRPAHESLRISRGWPVLVLVLGLVTLGAVEVWRARAADAETSATQKELARVSTLIAALVKHDGGVVEHLTLLTNETDETRELEKIGKPAVPALIAALKNPNKHIRRHSALALGTIGDPAALEPLLDLCRDELFNASQHQDYFSTNDVYEPASMAVLRLIFPGHANDYNWIYGAMRGRFERALKRQGPDKRELPPLLEAMRSDTTSPYDDPDGSLRQALDIAIQKFSPANSASKPDPRELEKEMRDILAGLKGDPAADTFELPQPARDRIVQRFPDAVDALLVIAGAGEEDPLRAKALGVLRQLWLDLPQEKLEAFFKSRATARVYASPRYPQHVAAEIMTGYLIRFQSGIDIWRRKDGLTINTITSQTLDGQPVGKVFEFPSPVGGGPGIKVKDLRLGRHTAQVTTAYEITCRGRVIKGVVQSEPAAFEMVPESMPDELAAPPDPELERRVRAALQFSETVSPITKYHGWLMEPFIEDLWQPQITWRSRNGEELELHMPEWKLSEPLPVDLAFDVSIQQTDTSRTLAGDGLVFVKSGKREDTQYSDIIRPWDVEAFAAGREGFIPLRIVLTPSRARALSETAVTRYYNGPPIVLPIMRAKLTRYPAEPREAWLREMRTMLAELERKGTTDKDILSIIQSLTSTNPNTRAQAPNLINDTNRSRLQDAIPFLIGLLADTTTLTQNSFQTAKNPGEVAASALGSLGAAAVKPLVQALENPNPQVRRQAASALGMGVANDPKHRNPFSIMVAPLVGRLGDGDAGVRAAAAGALGTYPSPRAVEPLIQALQDPALEVRCSAIAALGALKDHRATGPIVAALQDPAADIQIRNNAVESLGALGDPAALDPLLTALRDPNDKVRRDAAWSVGYLLGRQKDRKALPGLLASLQDNAHDVCEGAAYALGMLGAPEAIDPLIAAIARPSHYFQGKPDPNTGQIAGEALKKITGQDFGADAVKWRAWRDQQKNNPHPDKSAGGAAATSDTIAPNLATRGNAKAPKAKAYLGDKDLSVLIAQLDDRATSTSWRKNAYAIGYASPRGNRQAIDALVKYLQTPDPRDNLQPILAGDPVYDLAFRKIGCFVWIGAVGGPHAEEILLRLMTPEGAAELVNQWGDTSAFHNPSDEALAIIRGWAAAGLAYCQSEKGMQLVEQALQEKLKNKTNSPLDSFYISAMAYKYYIDDHGVEQAIEEWGNDDRSEMMTYVKKASDQFSLPAAKPLSRNRDNRATTTSTPQTMKQQEPTDQDSSAATDIRQIASKALRKLTDQKFGADAYQLMGWAAPQKSVLPPAQPARLDDATSAAAEYYAKLHDPRKLVTIHGIEGTPFHELAKSFDRTSLPQFYAILKDEKAGMDEMSNAARYIAEIAPRGDWASLAVLIEAVKSPPRSPLAYDRTEKPGILYAIGRLGGPKAEEFLKRVSTPEGVAELTRSWPNPGGTNWERMIELLRGYAMKALAFSDRPETRQFITAAYEQEKQAYAKSRESTHYGNCTIEAMAVLDLIRDRGLESYLNLSDNFNELFLAIQPYLKIYMYPHKGQSGFTMNDGSSARDTRDTTASTPQAAKQQGPADPIRPSVTAPSTSTLQQRYAGMSPQQLVALYLWGADIADIAKYYTEKDFPTLFGILNKEDTILNENLMAQNQIWRLSSRNNDKVVEELVAFFQRPMNLEKWRNDELMFNQSIWNKTCTMQTIGRVGGARAEAILKQALTREGAEELAKAWIDGVPPIKYVSRESILRSIRGEAAMGLVYLNKPEAQELVKTEYERERQACIQANTLSECYSHLASAMMKMDQIKEYGFESERADYNQAALQKYFPKYELKLTPGEPNSRTQQKDVPTTTGTTSRPLVRGGASQGLAAAAPATPVQSAAQIVEGLQARDWQIHTVAMEYSTRSSFPDGKTGVLPRRYSCVYQGKRVYFRMQDPEATADYQEAARRNDGAYLIRDHPKDMIRGNGTPGSPWGNWNQVRPFFWPGVQDAGDPRLGDWFAKNGAAVLGTDEIDGHPVTIISDGQREKQALYPNHEGYIAWIAPDLGFSPLRIAEYRGGGLHHVYQFRDFVKTDAGLWVPRAATVWYFNVDLKIKSFDPARPGRAWLVQVDFKFTRFLFNRLFRDSLFNLELIDHGDLLAEADQDFGPLKYVALAASRDKMTFQGREATLEQLPELLRSVSDRAHTVLQAGATVDVGISSRLRDYEFSNKATTLANQLARELGFHSCVDSSVMTELGAVGSVEGHEALEFNKEIPLALTAGTVDDADALQTKWVRFQAAGDKIRVRVHGTIHSAPKTYWSFTVVAFNAQGETRVQAFGSLTNSGISKGTGSVDEFDFDFPNDQPGDSSYYYPNQVEAMRGPDAPDRFSLAIRQFIPLPGRGAGGNWVVATPAANAASKGATPGDPKVAAVKEDMLSAFETSKEIWRQEEIAWKLIALGDKSVLPRIEKLMDTPNRGRRCIAALVMAGLFDERGLEVLIKELQDKGPRPTALIRSDGKPDIDGQIRQDRYTAARLLGLLKNNKAVPALIEAAKDSTIDYQAAISLGWIGDKQAIPALRRLAEAAGDDSLAKLYANDALALLGDPQGFTNLLLLALAEKDWGNRRLALDALGETGDLRALPVLLGALRAPDARARSSAAQALGRLGDASAIPALEQALARDPAGAVPDEANAPPWRDAFAKAIAKLKGSAVEGVDAVLRPERVVWDLAEIPILRADMHNKGEGSWVAAMTQDACELEVDGAWYERLPEEWRGGLTDPPGYLRPGGQFYNTKVTLDSAWHLKGGGSPLKLKAGRHAVRVVFTPRATDKNSSKTLRVVSDPVEIELFGASGGTP